MVGLDGLATMLVSLAAIVATLGASLAWALVWTLRVARRTRAGVDGKGRRVIVLGRRLAPGNAVAAAYRERLDRAAALLAGGTAAEVVVLGGRTSRDGPSEAEAGRAYLRDRGAPADRIAIEDTSRHTLENLIRYRAAFGTDGAPVVLVTSRAHLARAGLTARGLGIPHEPCAAEAVWRWTPGELASLLVEGFYVHWYLAGRTFARVTRNRAMLGRIG